MSGKVMNSGCGVPVRVSTGLKLIQTRSEKQTIVSRNAFSHQKISGVFSTVLFPAFSQLQEDKPTVKQMFLKTIKVISLITFPLMFGLSSLADVFVLSVFGDQWHAMIPILQVLAVLGAFQSLGTLVGSIYVSMGATKLQFKVGLVIKPLLIASIIFGLQYGLEGLVWCYAIVSILCLLPDFYLAGQLIQLSVKEVVLAFIPAFIGSCLMVISIVSLRHFVLFSNDITTLTCSIIAGIFCYTIILYYLFKRHFFEIINMIKKQLSLS